MILKTSNYLHTRKQCREKMMRLKQEYKKVKDQNNQSEYAGSYKGFVLLGFGGFHQQCCELQSARGSLCLSLVCLCIKRAHKWVLSTPQPEVIHLLSSSVVIMQPMTQQKLGSNHNVLRLIVVFLSKNSPKCPMGLSEGTSLSMKLLARKQRSEFPNMPFVCLYV